jgi:hypothetical protein
VCCVAPIASAETDGGEFVEQSRKFNGRQLVIVPASIQILVGGRARFSSAWQTKRQPTGWLIFARRRAAELAGDGGVSRARRFADKLRPAGDRCKNQ